MRSAKGVCRSTTFTVRRLSRWPAERTRYRSTAYTQRPSPQPTKTGTKRQEIGAHAKSVALQQVPASPEAVRINGIRTGRFAGGQLPLLQQTDQGALAERRRFPRHARGV